MDIATQKKVVDTLRRLSDSLESLYVSEYNTVSPVDAPNISAARELITKLSPKTVDGITCPHTIEVVGRRWFERTNGNTYHVTRVYVDGELVYTSPITYGYDDGYAQTGFEWLLKSKTIPHYKGRYHSNHPPSHWRYIRDELGIEYSYHASDVSRKKDL